MKPPPPISRRYSDKKSPRSDDITSEDLAKKVAEYLAGGGKVQEVPFGVGVLGGEENDDDQ